MLPVKLISDSMQIRRELHRKHLLQGLYINQKPFARKSELDIQILNTF